MLDSADAIEILSESPLISGIEGAAEAMVRAGKIDEYPDESRIYEDGEVGRGLFFVLTGRVRLEKQGNVLSTREPREHFGSWPVLDRAWSYKVSAVAAGAKRPTTLLLVPRKEFKAIANEKPEIWMRLARNEALYVKNANMIRVPLNEPPQLLILSVSEDVEKIGKRLKSLLEKSLHVILWTEGFKPSDVTIETLERWGNQADFAVLIWTPLGRGEQRKERRKLPGDNVLFETGLFMGALGRHRTYLIMPKRDAPALPSDLFGVTTLTYETDAKGRPQLDEVAAKIKGRIGQFGAKKRFVNVD